MLQERAVGERTDHQVTARQRHGIASVQSGRLQWQAALTEEADGVAHNRELQGPPAADAVAQVAPYEITRQHKKILRADDAADPYLLHLCVPRTNLLHEKGKRRQDDSEPKKVGKNAQQGRPVAPCLVHGWRRRAVVATRTLYTYEQYTRRFSGDPHPAGPGPVAKCI